MLLLAVGFILGGFVGCLVMALVIASRDEHADLRSASTRTANRARELGASWVIAGNGAVTTGSRLGRFSVARRRAVLPL